MPALSIFAAVLMALAAGWLVFTRDPQRYPPGQPGLLAPADGRVLLVERVTAAPAGLDGPAWRVVIFLALWDVHVQRAPEAGRVVLSRSQAGGHAPAMHTRAAGNAGHWLGLATEGGPVLVLRLAGLLARRITTTVSVEAQVTRGERIGRIWLGSRTELFFGHQWRPVVRAGQHVRAGESLIAQPAGETA